MNFLAKKNEHFYIFNQYAKYNHPFAKTSAGYFRDPEAAETSLNSKYFPETYTLPAELSSYRHSHKSNPGSAFVFKTSSGSQGSGVHILRSYSDFEIVQ